MIDFIKTYSNTFEMGMLTVRLLLDKSRKYSKVFVRLYRTKTMKYQCRTLTIWFSHTISRSNNQRKHLKLPVVIVEHKSEQKSIKNHQNQLKNVYNLIYTSISVESTPISCSILYTIAIIPGCK